ncbi:MAG: tetratricopeptide repeat protein [Cyanobacteria bacterium J06600_6]
MKLLRSLNILLLISALIVLPETVVAEAKSYFITAQAQENELDSEAAYTQRALMHEQQENYESALKDYSRAIEINPNMAEAYNNRGLIFMRKGDYNLALADYS